MEMGKASVCVCVTVFRVNTHAARRSPGKLCKTRRGWVASGIRMKCFRCACACSGNAIGARKIATSFRTNLLFGP